MIGVLVADDHPVVREGLRGILARDPEVQVVGEAEDGPSAVVAAGRAEVDVVLLDIAMPGPGFVETLRQLRSEHPDVPVVVLSVHPEEQFAVRALQAGAAAYLTKDAPPEQLLAAIHTVNSEGRFLSPAQARLVAQERERAGAPPHAALSEREFQVLLRICAGGATKDIASELNLSPKTVSTYRSRLLAKLGLSSNADLVRYALDHKLA